MQKLYATLSLITYERNGKDIMSLFISQLVNGLCNSASLFLVAIGLVIIFGLLDVVNMAHGELIMIGAYCGYVCNSMLHLPFFISLILAFIFSGLIGMIIEHLLIRKLYGKVAETLLVTFGLTYVLQQIVRSIFGPEERLVKIPIEGSLELGSITVPYYNLFLIMMALVVLGATLILINKTSYGMQLRAITQNRQMSQCLGIDTAKIDKMTFAYGCALSGLAGALIAPISSVTPTMGITYVVDSFLVVVLGGLNSIVGSLFGATVIDESVTLMAGYMSQITAKLLIFIVIIVVIRFKPEGLFSSKERR